ncbi:MAG: hypothetical protein IKK21_10230 [Clostridia bacterium]|nr:hypothetical protein [Clostridia bacterium]
MKELTAAMAKKIEDVLAALERLQLAEYIRYVDDRRRLVRTHFLAGLARGMGMAVGFTILGAALVILLNRLAQRNLPIIGDFLADIVQIVQRRLE